MKVTYNSIQFQEKTRLISVSSRGHMYQQPISLFVGNIKIKQDLILSLAEDIVSLVTYLLSFNVFAMIVSNSKLLKN